MVCIMSVIYAAAQLVKSILVNWRAVRDATSILFYPEGGFGHTIHAPDMLRRRHPDGLGVVFFGFSPGRHNPQVSHLFRDVRLIFVPVSIALTYSGKIKLLPSKREYSTKLFYLMAKFAAFILKNKRIYIDSDLFVISGNSLADFGGRMVWRILAYLQILQTTTAQSIGLPSALREGVEAQVKEKSEHLVRQPSMQCCLYLRSKGGPEHPADQIKSGSEICEYIGALTVLVEKDYRVLVIGDRHLTHEIKHRFGAAVLEADDLDIDPDIFNLYAATETDIFIGDSGAGGCWLSFLNNIPALILNAYPYFLAPPLATMYFKTMFDNEGCSVSVERMFNEYHADIIFDDVTIAPNSAEEIEFAVRDFLDRDDVDQVYGVSLDEICDSPNYLWIHHANSKISPAWLKVHQEGGFTANEINCHAQGFSSAENSLPD